MCFLWQLGQRVIANHLMVLTFQQDRTVCSGSVFFYIYILLEFPKQIKTVVWPTTATCDQAYSVTTVKRDHVFSRLFGDISLVRTWLSFWEIWRHARVVRLFSKHVRQSFFFFFFLAVQVCFLTFITMVNDKGSFDTHKHMCKMCLCMQLIYKKKPLLHV